MSKAITKKLESGMQIGWIWEFYLLVKFRLSMMVVISSVLAYLIVAGASFSWTILILLFVGGFCVTAAANGINQVLEKEYDAIMERTKMRPLAADRMKSSEAVLFSGLILLLGIILLAMINPITAFFGMFSFVLYAFLYTPLKRYSTVSVAVGAIPGAFPVLIGAVAHDATITTLGITLFMIQFLWQFPHFWAISFLSFDDYDKAGYKLLPKNQDGTIDKNLGMYSTIYSMLIIPTVLWAYLNNDLLVNPIGLSIIIGVTLIYSFLGLRLQFNPNRKTALHLMLSSFFYLPLVLFILLIG